MVLDRVQVRLLGPVEVMVGAEEVRPVPGLRRQAVLAVLALRAGEIVSTDRLIEIVWGQKPPATALNTLQSHVSYLRGVLGAKAAILARSPGYVLDLDSETTDVQAAERLIRQGTQATDPVHGARDLQAAVGLWRGPPLGDVTELAWLGEQAERLDQLLLQAQQALAQTRLALGEHTQLLPDLQQLAQQHPLHEHLHRLLILALYRAGRQADALTVYQRLRRALDDELGIDPSQALRELETAILRQDPTLTLPPCPLTAGPVPAQLPPAVAAFTGRQAELAHLDTLLPRPSQQTPTRPPAVVISAVSGTAGVGKTALAVHWAHRIAAQFPDGQLYVNLRGFDPTGTRMDPAEAIRGFLHALGVVAERIPTSPAAQAGLYRSMLAGKRILVVLDNAHNVDQVRPLLPATPGCLAIVTSRNPLTGLAATEGAHMLTLDLFTHAEAQDLLTARLGAHRVAADPHAVNDIIASCARLPLALAIAAARASTHPHFALQVLAKELADEHTRLDALDTGDPTTSARAVFSWSYQHFSTSAARMFRLLGLHPGPDIALPAATHLIDLTPHQAREALSELTRAHLLTQHAPGRYTFHDLLRAYATELTTVQDPQGEQHTALTRLFDHYLAAAAAANDALRPADHEHRPDIPALAIPDPPVTARAWLKAEQVNLTAIIAYTAARGWHTHTTRLANMVLRYLNVTTSGNRDVLVLCTHVHHAARHTGDRATEALALTSLGQAYWQQGRYRQAAEHHQEALAICREIGDRVGEALALTNLGVVFWLQGRYQQAAEHHQQALTISRDIGDRETEALALTNLGAVFWRQGRYQQAAEHHRNTLAICREIRVRPIEAIALTHLGLIHWQQGRYQQATEHHQQALTISRDIGFRAVEAVALTNLGLVHQLQGHYQQATEHHQQALTISRDIGDRNTQAFALTNLGLVHQLQGHCQLAAEYHQQAIALCRDIDFRAIEALALTNLGLVHQLQGLYQQAAEHHQQALAICRDIGDRANEAQILNRLGQTHQAIEHPYEARIRHAGALTLAAELGDRYEQARAHHSLAHTHHTTGSFTQASAHWHQALAIYTDLGVPDADNVRDDLADLN